MLGQLDLASESLFAGRYRVVRRIAAGGMGAVFEVVHIETQRRRALKVMLPELLANRQLRERFQMEARITANVESEYIVDVFDAGIDAATGMPFLVMELLHGEDLAKVLERTGPPLAEVVITYLRQVASALDKTHAAGIVHRDLKPENLFLTHREDGTPRVKILDFGISKLITEASTGANATRGLGTPLYMAPEQVLAQALSSATDLYALGLIAYTLLVGAPYWQHEADLFDNAISFVVHTSKGATVSAVGRAAQGGRLLPQAFDAWFQRATHLDIAQRFRSAAELVRELATALGVQHSTPPALGSESASSFVRTSPRDAVQTTSVRTAPGTEFDRKSTLSGAPARRKRALGLGFGAAVLALCAVLGVLALRSRVSAVSAASDVKSALVTVAAEPAPSVSVVVAPASSARAAATGPVKPPVLPAVGVPAKAALGAKAPSTAHELAPIKTQSMSAQPVPAPKYTRD